GPTPPGVRAPRRDAVHATTRKERASRCRCARPVPARSAARPPSAAGRSKHRPAATCRDGSPTPIAPHSPTPATARCPNLCELCVDRRCGPRGLLLHHPIDDRQHPSLLLVAELCRSRLVFPYGFTNHVALRLGQACRGPAKALDRLLIQRERDLY